MCVSPVVVFNPYFSSDAWQYHKGAVKPLDSRFVSAKSHIEVPCGKCVECRQSYYSAIRQRAQVESMTSYVYFITLTYDDEHIPSIRFTSDDGVVTLYYSDFSHLQSMFKRLRNEPLFKARGFRYLAVTEYGTSRFRPHFHVLLFVGRLPGDHCTTAQDLEEPISSLLRRYYALNVGTRKNPVYQPLFTYRRNPNTNESNFKCQLVRDYSVDPSDPRSLNSSVSIAKSVSYLISYVSKPSQYDSILEDGFNSVYCPEDVKRRLSRLLKSRLVYSKHFGFGFDNGLPVRPSLRSVSVTTDRRQLRDLYKSLPDPIDETAEYSPDDFLPDEYEAFRESFIHPDNVFLMSCDYRGYSVGRLLNKELSSVDYFYAHMLRAREPRLFRSICRQLHLSSADYYPNLLPRSPFDSSFESSVAYRYIRRCVESGLSARASYLSFDLVSGSSVTSVPLCKYYRRYCCDFSDVSRLYRSLGVSSYDEYVDLITPARDSYRLRLQSLWAAHEQLHDQRRSRYYKLNENHRNFVKSKIRSIFAPTSQAIDAITTLA